MSDSISTLKSCNFDKLNLSLRKYTKARNRYKKCYTKWRDNRRANIVNIRLLIIGLEQTKHKTNIAGLTSGVGGVVGGVLTGVGLITMPFSRKYFLWSSPVTPAIYSSIAIVWMIAWTISCIVIAVDRPIARVNVPIQRNTTHHSTFSRQFP